MLPIFVNTKFFNPINRFAVTELRIKYLELSVLKTVTFIAQIYIKSNDNQKQNILDIDNLWYNGSIGQANKSAKFQISPAGSY